MFDSACCRTRSEGNSAWLIGGSLTLVAVSLAMTWAGDDHYSQALLLSSFPIALLTADRTMRRERPLRTIFGAAALYGFMLLVMRLGESF